jgi:hypothetical protein
METSSVRPFQTAEGPLHKVVDTREKSLTQKQFITVVTVFAPLEHSPPSDAISKEVRELKNTSSNCAPSRVNQPWVGSWAWWDWDEGLISSCGRCLRDPGDQVRARAANTQDALGAAPSPDPGSHQSWVGAPHSVFSSGCGPLIVCCRWPRENDCRTSGGDRFRAVCEPCLTRRC